MYKFFLFLLALSIPLFSQEIHYVSEYTKIDENERYVFPIEAFLSTPLLKPKASWGDFYVSYDDKKNRFVKYKGFYLALKNPQTNLEIKTYTTFKSTFDLFTEVIDSQGLTLSGKLPLTPISMDLKVTSNPQRSKGGVETNLKVKF